MTAAAQNQLPLFAAAAGQGAREGADWSVRVNPRARRLSVRVYPGGAVSVTVPPGTPPLAVEAFIRRHRSWIDARVAEFTAREAALPEVIRLDCFDEEWRVSYLDAARAGFRVRYPGHLEVRVPGLDPRRGRLQLRRWLLGEGTRRLGPWLTRVARERGFRFSRCQVRRQRTRWGSCARSGTISLNVCLLFQPPEVVHYLFVHELCHTRHMNHSARFWALVEAHEPDWKALDRRLTQGWRQVPHWVYG